jgi:adenylate cyclase
MELIDLDVRIAAPVPERRWGAVLTADVVEYSRLTRIDEEQTYLQYQTHRREVLYPKTREYGARFLKSTGDGIMAEFRSALDAARCAIDVQRSMDQRSGSTAEDHRIIFRIGLSCGRIIADPEDIYGHDVNVSARLQTIAPPGGIAMSGEVAALVRQMLPIALEDMGEQHFHNMNCAVRVFQYRPSGCSQQQVGG